ncbi:MAG: hypothetical protein ACRD3K_11645, partial [Edaphobacter sp.]
RLQICEGDLTSHARDSTASPSRVPGVSDAVAEGTAKNKLQKVGVFLAPQFSASKHHASPHIHHVFTSEKPRSAHRFLQNPQQKHTLTTQIIFSASTIRNPSERI